MFDKLLQVGLRRLLLGLSASHQPFTLVRSFSAWLYLISVLSSCRVLQVGAERRHQGRRQRHQDGDMKRSQQRPDAADNVDRPLQTMKIALKVLVFLR